MGTVTQPLAFLLGFLLLEVSSAGEIPPVPPRTDDRLIDACEYPNGQAAQSAWKAMRGSASASVVNAGGRAVLELPCNFEGTRIERASWDRAVALDLAACRGVRFQFYSPDTSPVSHFTLYFQSGSGWYTAPFSPHSTAGWGTVEIEKTQARIEGAPAGWGRIETIRLSAWRGRDANAKLYVADLGLLGADAPVAVVRADSAIRTQRTEARSVRMYSQTVARCLERLGLPHFFISDLDITAKRLKGKAVVILPHNPGMPDKVAGEIVEYVAGGGKVVAFYILPEKLGAIVGIQGGRHISRASPGQFSSLRFTKGVLAGSPDVVHQNSWNINEARAVEGKSRVAAFWHDGNGNNTGHAGVIVSESCALMTHVLLAEDPMSASRLLLAMVGHVVPDLWQQAARASVERIGKIGRYQSFDEAASALRRKARGHRDAVATLERARGLRQRAITLGEEAEFSTAIAAASEAQRLMVEAYSLAQEPEEGEHRAFWCHSAFGVVDLDWDRAIRKLADNGFTAILPNMLWGGTAYYESDVLPVAREVAERGDQIAECVAACKKHGVQCHVWKVNWNMASRASRAFAAKMRASGRTQVRFDGGREDQWLCPSHPENRRLEIDSMVEVATKYDVDGIHFDYIRYPGPDSCFCQGCRTRFQKTAGLVVKDWPAAVRSDDNVQAKWLDFRRGNITRVVASVAEAVRRVKPKVKISAAVFRSWPVDRDKVGQDWKLWCEKGYLDFVCPMDYTPSSGQFEDILRAQLEWAGEVPCYPGIGLSTWPDKGDICKLIDQINISRRLKTGGFTIFNYGVSEARDILPLCGKGITRP